LSERRKRISTLFGVMIIITVVLTACSHSIQPSTEAVASDAASSDGVQIDGQAVADFRITLYQGQEIVGGQEVQFSALLDQGKPVVLNLWAGLCPPCRLEMPDFQEASNELGDQVLFLGLDVGPFTNLGTSQDGQELVQQLGVTYPVGTTGEVDVVRDYGLIGMPTTYFITPDGEIFEQWTGLLNQEKLTELVEALLDASSGSQASKGG
jgi:thiol-disulfide isomerase/thioredoxin